jgi:hypothetical protein
MTFRVTLIDQDGNRRTIDKTAESPDEVRAAIRASYPGAVVLKVKLVRHG